MLMNESLRRSIIITLSIAYFQIPSGMIPDSPEKGATYTTPHTRISCIHILQLNEIQLEKK